MTPIRNRLRNEITVRHNHRDVVIGHHRGTTQADFLYAPSHASHFNAIANGNGLLGENDDAAHEIIDDVLQSKTDTHTNRAGNKGQRT